MLEIYEIDNTRIDKKSQVTMTKCGNVTEIKYLSHVNREMAIRKINNPDGYLNIFTGEYYELCNNKKTREDNYWGLRLSMRRLKNYINTNITTGYNVRWLTLTYAQRSSTWDESIPMRDTKRLYLDFQMFIAALRTAYINYKIEYISVAEPQRSGSWHLHVFLIFDREAPFIPNNVLRNQFWRQGFVKITKISEDCDNVGAYFSVYLTDLEYNKNEDKDVPKELIVDRTLESGNIKKFIKGGRLKFYPAFFNLYRCSRGIIGPEIIKDTTYGDIETDDLGVLTYKKAILVEDKEKNYSVRIVYEYYNSKRKEEK